jgi:hypothetical protein
MENIDDELVVGDDVESSEELIVEHKENNGRKKRSIIEIPTQEFLRECFDYESETGKAIWKERPISHFRTEQGMKSSNKIRVGEEIKVINNNGFYMIGVDNYKFRLDVAIWKWYYGEDPTNDIIHINGDVTDNRISNLKLHNYIEIKKNIIFGNILELPTQEYLLECFRYDEETGLLFWKERPSYHFKGVGDDITWNNVYANTPAGNFDSRGYLRITISYLEYRIHRVIWKLVYGYDSEFIIDHINGVRTDNRICNLREATSQENVRNKSRLSSKNTSGFTGVHYDKSRKKWLATIKRLGVTTRLGTFATIEEAVEVRETAAKEMFGEFYRDLRV